MYIIIYILTKHLYIPLCYQYYMKRKVVKLGPSTLVVSLPSKWIKSQKIEAGNELEMTEAEGTLVLNSGDKKKEKKEITVEITDENRHNLLHILTHVYRAGYAKITIKGDNLSDEVKNITKDILLGFEVTNRGNESCIIENVAEPTEDKYETMLRRAFLITKETQEKLIELFEGKKVNKEDFDDLKKQHDRFVVFCRRIIFQKGNKEDILRWELLTNQMQLQHAHYYLFKYVDNNGFDKDKNIAELLMGLQTYYDLLYEGCFKKDVEKLHKLHKEKDKYQYGRCFELLNSKKNAVVYSYIREMFRLTQCGSSPLLSLFLSY